MAFEGLLSVVIPVYRSQAYLERTVDELVSALEPEGRFEIILVNDGSPDDVQAVIDRLHARDPRVRFIEMGSNRGQHAATLRGFAVAQGDIVVTVDDDGQNPPEAVLAVASALQARRLNDVVYGRFGTVEQHPVRRLVSRINQWVFRHTMGNKTGVRVTNVRALRGGLARQLGAWESIYPYIDSMVFRSTRRVSDVLVPHRPRGAGQSTYRIRDLARLWLSHVSSLTVLPLKFATLGCFLTAAVGFTVGVVQMVRALLSEQAPEGWLSLFCAITFLFSLLFAFMGVLSTYVGRMYVSHNSRGLGWVRSTGGISAAGAPPAEVRQLEALP